MPRSMLPICCRSSCGRLPSAPSPAHRRCDARRYLRDSASSAPRMSCAKPTSPCRSPSAGDRESRLYAPNMGGQAANLVSLEADLHVAIEKKQLRLLFQPIVDLRTGKMVGAEALLRWRHPVEGLLAPERFLRIAEEAGLMVPITRWIILRVVKLAGEWRRAWPPARISTSPSIFRRPRCAIRAQRLPCLLGRPAAALVAQVRADRSGPHRQRRRGARNAEPPARHGHSVDAR